MYTNNFQIYTSKFFWNFKRMDNVNYNFEMLNMLIQAGNLKELEENRKYLYKPIFITIVSIIECILYDFLLKIQEHRYEKIPSLTERDIESISNLDIPNKLFNFIEICEKNELLGKKDDCIYEDCKNLAKIRNRVHIQNAKQDDPLDEFKLWKPSLIDCAGNSLKKICEIMYKQYPRPDYFHQTPDRPHIFPTPWRQIS